MQHFTPLLLIVLCFGIYACEPENTASNESIDDMISDRLFDASISDNLIDATSTPTPQTDAMVWGDMSSVSDMSSRQDMTIRNDAMTSDGMSNISGVVWMPGHGPHQVDMRDTIPVSGALVYVSNESPTPLPDAIYCDACTQANFTAVTTDAQGRFQLDSVPSGRRFLIVEKGRFRRVTEVEFRAGETLQLPSGMTTLPSQHDPNNGAWIPRIAIATGMFDSLEDILAKMGMASVSADGDYVRGSAMGRFDLYDNGGSNFEDELLGTLEELMSDYNLMQNYHIILIPCSGLFDYSSALQNPVVRENIRRYVAYGGRLYVTDWSGEWVDNIFPTQIELNEGDDTPPEAYDEATNSWRPELFGDANGLEYDTPNAEVVDGDMATWLSLQSGPDVYGDFGPYDTSYFGITGSYNIIRSVNEVTLGANVEGELVIDQPKVWVVGGSEDHPEPKYPMTVTYEPIGCGRVLYTTYHTTDETHVGLVQQERILLYLLMEISICRNPKSIVSLD